MSTIPRMFSTRTNQENPTSDALRAQRKTAVLEDPQAPPLESALKDRPRRAFQDSKNKLVNSGTQSAKKSGSRLGLRERSQAENHGSAERLSFKHIGENPIPVLSARPKIENVQGTKQKTEIAPADSEPKMVPKIVLEAEPTFDDDTSGFPFSERPSEYAPDDWAAEDSLRFEFEGIDRDTVIDRLTKSLKMWDFEESPETDLFPVFTENSGPPPLSDDAFDELVWDSPFV